MRQTESPPSRVLLTLGRLPKALELARALKRAGCKVFVADPYGSHLCKPSRAVKRSFKVTAPNTDPGAYCRDLLDIIIGEGIDLVVPVSEEAPQLAPLAGSLPSGTHLFGPDGPTLAVLGNKLHFADRARELGLAVPETHRANRAEAAALAARTDHVIKPVHGSSGNGLRLRRAGEPLRSGDVSADNLVQRRIHGRHVSSFTLARGGEALVTVAYEGGIMSGTTAVSFIRVDDAPQVVDWVEAFVAAKGFDGFISFDFIIDEAGTAYAIECNPRLTSGVHFVRHGTLAAFVTGAALPVGSQLKPKRKLQEGHTGLTEVYAALFTGKLREASRRLGHLVTSKDVLFELRDPLPFLLMTPMSWPVLSRVMFRGMSFGEAATHDIQWRPETLQPDPQEVSADAAHAS
jgi:predicted ATP-grasp superfamily ATP-dependent carboligase